MEMSTAFATELQSSLLCALYVLTHIGVAVGIEETVVAGAVAVVFNT